VRHLQVTLRWRYRRQVREGIKRIEPIEHGIVLWEKEDVAACTRTTIELIDD
jgi:hypothetical protein